MTQLSLACVASASTRAQDGLKRLRLQHDFVPPEQADGIVALGGDGFMLDSLHRYMSAQRPIYGMNLGTVGFLMNSFNEFTLQTRVAAAKAERLSPLQVKATDINGKTHEALAFNEIAVLRHSNQSANLQISVDGKIRMDKLMSDGVLICTPAGSTAYNLSVHGPIIPIGADIVGLTPISPFRPRRWRGALLPYNSVVEITNLDPIKRPLAVSADSSEIRDAAHVRVSVDVSRSMTVLFDSGHSLEERIINEQFSA